MVYQSGYLTIKSYLPEEEAFMLDFPNEEVRSGLVSLLASDYLNIDRIVYVVRMMRKSLSGIFSIPCIFSSGWPVAGKFMLRRPQAMAGLTAWSRQRNMSTSLSSSWMARRRMLYGR